MAPALTEAGRQRLTQVASSNLLQLSEIGPKKLRQLADVKLKNKSIGRTHVNIDSLVLHEQKPDMNQPIRLLVSNKKREQNPVNVVGSDKGANLLNVDLSAGLPEQGGAGDQAGDAPGIVNLGCGDAPQAETSPRDSIQDISRRQHLQHRRALGLLRRLRRLQCRQAQGHVTNQISDYVSYHHHNLETMAQNIKSTVQQTPGPSTSADFTPEMLNSEKIRSLSTAALVNLVRKLQSTQTMSLRQRSTQSESPATLLRMNKNIRLESERAADQLIYNLKYCERALDSDATESSSGGESCEETERLEGGMGAQLPWCQDRAQVAARWTWLQAQVSDLEYKIRAQTDIHRRLRASKGSIESSQTNGIVEEELPARCRPITTCKRRRLFRTQQLVNSPKATRQSSLICRCYPPVNSCAMCMGLQNHTKPLNAEMSRNEKLALLDSGYHPVLSFPEDVALPLAMAPLVRSVAGLEKSTPRYMCRSPYKPNKYRKKYQRSKAKKLKKTNLISMKYKQRLDSKQNKRRDNRNLSRTELRKRKKLKIALKIGNRSASASRQNSAQTSPRDSPLPSGSHSTREMKHFLRKKKAENNYDIDNIVIPHSIAASTRVEKLEYKEIITPKWRVNVVPESTNPDIDEDLTDDMFAARHVICEVREKQRYLHFGSSRRKGSMRPESGANTPDPEQDTPPATPVPLDTRRRSSSITRTVYNESRTCSPVLEDPYPVQAWEPRKFPLNDEQYQLLLAEKPEETPPATSYNLDTASVVSTPGSSVSVTPAVSGDEQSDPEWNLE